MGVYINMEMPKEGSWITLRVFPDGQCVLHSWCGNDDKIKFDFMEHLTAVNVPKPHGRLIDADALHKLFEDQWHYLQVLDWNENPTAEAKQSGISWCINTMHDDAPTIIPASEEAE